MIEVALIMFLGGAGMVFVSPAAPSVRDAGVFAMWGIGVMVAGAGMMLLAAVLG